MSRPIDNKPKGPGIFSLLKPYTGLVTMLILFALFSNAVSLWLPKIMQHGIDDYIHSLFTRTHFNINPTLVKFSIAAAGIFIFAYLQTIVQIHVSGSLMANGNKNSMSDSFSGRNNARSSSST